MPDPDPDPPNPSGGQKVVATERKRLVEVMPGRRKHELPLHYVMHAQHQMQRRGITEAQVREVLRQPSAKRPAKSRDATRYEKKLSKNRTIVVIAEERERFIRIVSAWIDE